MKIADTVLPYLIGEKFSNGLTLPIAKKRDLFPNRIDYVCEYLSGKKVLHVGCVDHVIKEKVKQNKWLHARIDDVAKLQLGIDINKEGIAFLKKELLITNVIYENILDELEPNQLIKNEKWDVMFLGEILEHVDNPVTFLSGIKKKYAPHVQKMMITVPNAFTLSNFLLALKGKECINSDHRSWFSPFTLSKILCLSGFNIVEFDFVTSFPEDYKKDFFKRILLKKYPALNSNIIMIASFT
jgi:2-polyprenyl-3-methyl-5-hydroxy-6-metoxy-1,4-benzoquinol methylase